VSLRCLKFPSQCDSGRIRRCYSIYRKHFGAPLRTRAIVDATAGEGVPQGLLTIRPILQSLRQFIKIIRAYTTSVL